MKVACLFTLALICIGLSGCNKNVSDSFKPEEFFPRILKNENIIPEKIFVLYLSEGMCAECINKEFMNLKECDKLLNNIAVVGVFSNKRIFNSCVNSLKPKEKFFYDMKDLKEGEELPLNPIYFVYDREKKEISDVFYPQPCRIVQTFEYFKNIETVLFPEKLVNN